MKKNTILKAATAFLGFLAFPFAMLLAQEPDSLRLLLDDGSMFITQDAILERQTGWEAFMDSLPYLLLMLAGLIILVGTAIICRKYKVYSSYKIRPRSSNYSISLDELGVTLMHKDGKSLEIVIDDKVAENVTVTHIN